MRDRKERAEARVLLVGEIGLTQRLQAAHLASVYQRVAHFFAAAIAASKFTC